MRVAAVEDGSAPARSGRTASPTPREVALIPAPHAAARAWPRGVERLISQRLLFALRAFQPDLILMSTGSTGAGTTWATSCSAIGAARSVSICGLAALCGSPRSSAVDLCCQGRLVSVLEGGYGTCDAAAVAANAAAAAAASAAAAAAATEAAAVAETTPALRPPPSTPPVLLPPLRLAQLGECRSRMCAGSRSSVSGHARPRHEARSIAPGSSTAALAEHGPESGPEGRAPPHPPTLRRGLARTRRHPSGPPPPPPTNCR